MMILQVTKLKEEPALDQLDVDDDRAIEAFVETAVKRHGNLMADQILARRVYAAQIFVEAVRREAQAAGVQSIDPRSVFASQADANMLFYDEVHLTDEGNRLLAQVIADHLHGGAPDTR